MKTTRTPSAPEFLQFLRANVVPWTEAEMARVDAVIAKICPGRELFGRALPARITFIKTTGMNSEASAGYYEDFSQTTDEEVRELLAGAIDLPNE